MREVAPRSVLQLSIDPSLKEWVHESGFPAAHLLEIALAAAKKELSGLLGESFSYAAFRGLPWITYGLVHLRDGYYAFSDYQGVTFAAPYSVDLPDSDRVILGRVKGRRVVDIEYNRSIKKGNLLDCLPERKRRLVTLYAQGLSYKNIALRLDVDETYVRSTLCSVRKILNAPTTADICEMAGLKCRRDRASLRIDETQEKKLLKLYGTGHKRRFICEDLGIDNQAYNAAKARIYRRYGVKSLTEAYSLMSA